MFPDNNRGEDTNPMDDFEELVEALEDSLDAKERRRERAREEREANEKREIKLTIEDNGIDWNRFRHRPTHAQILSRRDSDEKFANALRVAWINYVAARQLAAVEFNRRVEVAWVAANSAEVDDSSAESLI